jgi:hypothetical protein
MWYISSMYHHEISGLEGTLKLVHNSRYQETESSVSGKEAGRDTRQNIILL